MACQLSNGTALCSAHADGGQSTLLFRHHHCYDYRAAYLSPHMIHKTLKNKTLKTIKKASVQIIPLVIIGYWIFTQKMTKQLILENSTKTNNTGNLVVTHKITQAKEQNVAPHLHTWSHCQPWRHWQSTANIASPMINECERVHKRVCVCLIRRAEESVQLNR